MVRPKNSEERELLKKFFPSNKYPMSRKRFWENIHSMDISRSDIACLFEIFARDTWDRKSLRTYHKANFFDQQFSSISALISPYDAIGLACIAKKQERSINSLLLSIINEYLNKTPAP